MKIACSLASWRDLNPQISGPDAVCYMDSPRCLGIKLVVPGIEPKSFFRAANTRVYFKSDSFSMKCILEVVDNTKTPAERTIIDRRIFEIKRFPAEVKEITWKLKKDYCHVTVKKKFGWSWETSKMR